MATNPAAPTLSSSVQITLRDGSTFTHTAQFSRRITAANDATLIGRASGILIIECVCCQGTPQETTYRHTFPEDISGYSSADIQAKITDAIGRLAAHHASVHKAEDFTDGLLPPAPTASTSVATGGVLDDLGAKA